MADNRGGYRRPTNPAPVSGPGQHARRTDGRANIADLPDAQYGENSDYKAVQQAGAAMAPQQAQAAALPTPLSAGTESPETPVTAGAEYGPGPGPGALGIITGDGQDAEMIRKYWPVIIKVADNPDATPSARAWARQVIAQWRG